MDCNSKWKNINYFENVFTLRHRFVQHVFDDVFNDGLTSDGALIGQVDWLICALTVIPLFLFLLET